MNIIRLNSIGEPFAKSGQATPPSGGGTEASSMEYLDVSGIDIVGGGQKTGNLIALCYHMNGSHSTIGDFILPIGQVYVVKTANLTSVRYLAFDFSSKVVMGGQTMSVRETLLTTGWTEAELNAIPRITEEQFYTL